MSALDPERPPKNYFDVINLAMEGFVEAVKVGAEQEKRAKLAKKNLTHMKEVALIDPVTGLNNRRVLENAYNRLRPRSDRRRSREKTEPLSNSIVLFDIDNFKGVNDTRGHHGGDEVLQGVASIMRKRAREPDSLVRYGGDEFAMVLPGTPPDEAIVLCRDIQDLAQREVQVTLSMGVAPINMHETLEDSLEMADRALYDAKEQGRNQVVICSELPGQQP